MGPVEQHGMGRDGGVEGVEHVQSHRRRRCSQSSPAHATTELKHASLLQLMMKPRHTPAPDNINRVELVPVLAQLTCSTPVLQAQHQPHCTVQTVKRQYHQQLSGPVLVWRLSPAEMARAPTPGAHAVPSLYERCTTAPPHHTQPMHSTIKHMSRPQPSNVHSRQ